MDCIFGFLIKNTYKLWNCLFTGFFNPHIAQLFPKISTANGVYNSQ